MPIYPRALFVWLWIWLGTTLVGVVRGFAFSTVSNLLVGQAFGAGLASAVVFFGAFLFVRSHREISHEVWMRVGLIWALLTVAAEFGLGYFVADIPLGDLADNYNPFSGRLAIVTLVSYLAAPALWSLALRRSRHPNPHPAS